jgi:hypothetical protein
VLDLYEQPTQAEVVRLCFNERPCQVYAPLPLAPGQARCVDYEYEYERDGTACVLLAYDLDTGQRYVQVRQYRTKAHYAASFDWLLASHYPHAARIELVQDNLNPRAYSSFYQHLRLTGRPAAPDATLSLHAQTRLLAQYGRNRVLRPGPSVLEPAHYRPAHAANPYPSLGCGAQASGHQNPLEFYGRSGANDAGLLVSQDQRRQPRAAYQLSGACTGDAHKNTDNPLFLCLLRPESCH